MNTALIGYTGFVGANLQHAYSFTDKYNSKNIKDIQNRSYDSIFCCGVSAKKWWANENELEDLKNISILLECLNKTKANTFILISTIDVYPNPVDVDENTIIESSLLDGYGKNRFYFENEVKKLFPNVLVLRLPALYGINLSKNFIFDLMNPIPKLLKNSLFIEIETLLNSSEKSLLNSCYLKTDRMDYELIPQSNLTKLLSLLQSINKTSLMFTDHRSNYQFYSLLNLKNDIDISLKNNIHLLNLSTPPISASSLAKELVGINFTNIIPIKAPANYNFKSAHDKIFNGENGYLYKKEEVILSIKNFFEKENLNGSWNI